MINSKRAYDIAGFEFTSEGLHPFMLKISLNTILENKDEMECIYVIQDDIDLLLDLEIGGKMILRADRNDEYSRMIILRTQ